LTAAELQQDKPPADGLVEHWKHFDPPLKQAEYAAICQRILAEACPRREARPQEKQTRP
jgi:hypothetical protein